MVTVDRFVLFVEMFYCTWGNEHSVRILVALPAYTFKVRCVYASVYVQRTLHKQAYTFTVCCVNGSVYVQRMLRKVSTHIL